MYKRKLGDKTYIDLIKAELHNRKISYKANDNIYEALKDEDIDDIVLQLTYDFEQVLKTLLIDVDNDPNSKETAKRLAKSFVHELMSGRYYPKPNATSFPNEDQQKYDGLLVIRAEIKSLCAHHWQNMRGIAFIGIIPKAKVLGLSKYIRIAQWVARRPQIQEQLGVQIADEIAKEIGTDDIAVHLALTHDCISCRGVNQLNSLTQTTILRGEFQQPDVKNEFMQNVQMNISMPSFV